MIVDTLANIYRYKDIHPQFEAVFDFIKINDLRKLPLGKHEVSDNEVFITIDRSIARSRDEAYLESHMKFIDIQVVLEGIDEMGWLPINRCDSPIGSYDQDRDILFYRNKPDFFIPVASDYFAIFFPEDGHMPLTGRNLIHKAVAKVAV